MTVISYPVPIYQNATIQSDDYKPSRFVINAITLGNPTVIQTTANHNYVVGQEVRILIPPTFGTRGLNGKKAYVLAIPNTNEVTLDISSVGLDAYVASSATTKAQLIAVGNINSGASNSNSLALATTIPGSFQNIS